MAYKYRLHEDAQQELNEILRWYIDNGGIDVADRFVVKLNTVVEILEDFPNIGLPFKDEPNILSMKIKNYPYRLYYRINKNELEVIGLSIYHSKRDLDKLIPVLKERIK